MSTVVHVRPELRITANENLYELLYKPTYHLGRKKKVFETKGENGCAYLQGAYGPSRGWRALYL